MKIQDATSKRVAKLIYEAWLSGAAGPDEVVWENHTALAQYLHYAIIELRNTVPGFEGDSKVRVSFPIDLFMSRSTSAQVDEFELFSTERNCIGHIHSYGSLLAFFTC